jgi:hypothetical protein
MSTNHGKHFYMGDNSGRGMSPKLWANCPWQEMDYDNSIGYKFFDDFTDIPVITTPTISSEAAYGGTRYKAFGSSGGTLVSGGGLGGDIVFTEATSNEGVSLATIATPFKIIRGGGNVWFEAKVKHSLITDAVFGCFIGLAETMTLSATVPIAAAGTLADQNFVGFHRLEADGDKFDTVYKANGVTQVSVQTDAVTIVAATYNKLGMFYDDSTYVLTFFGDGVPLTSTKTVPSAAGTDFPNDVNLGLVCATLGGDSAATFTNTLDWWAAAQTAP